MRSGSVDDAETLQALIKVTVEGSEPAEGEVVKRKAARKKGIGAAVKLQCCYS